MPSRGKADRLSPWWVRWPAYFGMYFGFAALVSLAATHDYLASLSLALLPALGAERVAEHTWRRSHPEAGDVRKNSDA